MKESTPYKIQLDLTSQMEKTIDNIEMGVLENGIAYLTQTGLSRLCHVQRTSIINITHEWANLFKDSDAVVPNKSRLSKIVSILERSNFSDDSLYVSFEKNGLTHHAYPAVVCMAILEFYAFESGNNPNKDLAQDTYRRFSSQALEAFILDSLGYKEEDPWKHFHDRVSIINERSEVPDGYFIIFKEISGMMVDLITSGLPVNQHTVPDISVGACWANHWKNNELSQKFGERQTFRHYYPEEFLQAKSNPQTPNAYPEEALSEFRRWFKHEYLPTKFPPYLLKKKGLLPSVDDAEKVIYALSKNRE